MVGAQCPGYNGQVKLLSRIACGDTTGPTLPGGGERKATMQIISQVRREEGARHNGELEFRRLLEVLPVGAYTTDAEGLITDFNQRAVELWGRQPKRNDPLDRY